jgi:hypothetical protein
MDHGKTATGLDTKKGKDSNPRRREFFAGMEEVEDEAERDWRRKEKAEVGLLKEVGEYETTGFSRER